MATAERLRIIGTPRHRVFGLRTDVFLSRILHTQRIASSLTLIARADVIVTEPVLAWLAERPGTMLADRAGVPLIGFHTQDAAGDSDAVGHDRVPAGDELVISNTATIFVRKLRRREPLEAFDLRETSTWTAEHKLFSLVYKGVTDVATMAWQQPAFLTVRLLSRWRVTPNMVTLASIVLVVAASYWFYQGRWVPGLAAGWLMAFLDTVDGKLARVTGTASKMGNLLDHGTDIIHPPIWWLCITVALARAGDAGSAWLCLGVILSTYFAGRVSEFAFKGWFGFNQYLWRPIDSRLRTVIARRNTILLLFTPFAALGAAAAGWMAVAAWSFVSVGVQLGCTAQALAARRRGEPIVSWLA